VRDTVSGLDSLASVFESFLPSLTLAQRAVFLEALVHLAGVNEVQLAEQAALYLTSQELRSLESSDFEIGNHTYSHVHCRLLSRDELIDEVDGNKAKLEDVSGTRVRSFSQPYGSSVDLTAELACHLRKSGHEAVFLSESVANPRGADRFHLDRVNSRVDRDDSLFLELELLPRVRAVRNRFFRGSESSLDWAGRSARDAN